MTKELTGLKVLLWLLGTFGVVFAVNGYFIAKAVESYPGEDVQHPYLQGVGYSRTLANHAAQAAQGWQATISGERTLGGNVLVFVTLRTKDGQLPSGFGLGGNLRHPTDEERDRPLLFEKIGGSAFVAHIAGVTPGAWDVVVTSRGNYPFVASRRLWLR